MSIVTGRTKKKKIPSSNYCWSLDNRQKKKKNILDTNFFNYMKLVENNRMLKISWINAGHKQEDRHFKIAFFFWGWRVNSSSHIVVIYTVLGDYKIQDIFIYIFSQLRQNQKCSVFYLKTAETKSKLLKKKKKITAQIFVSLRFVISCPNTRLLYVHSSCCLRLNSTASSSYQIDMIVRLVGKHLFSMSVCLV